MLAEIVDDADDVIVPRCRRRRPQWFVGGGQGKDERRRLTDFGYQRCHLAFICRVEARREEEEKVVRTLLDRRSNDQKTDKRSNEQKTHQMSDMDIY